MKKIEKRLLMEFRRVFGAADLYPDGSLRVVDHWRRSDGSVSHLKPPDDPEAEYVEGWPEAVLYDPKPALRVLRQYEDGYGESWIGDSEVCGALEAADAFLGFATRKRPPGMGPDL